jgi:hypothetical protein
MAKKDEVGLVALKERPADGPQNPPAPKTESPPKKPDRTVTGHALATGNARRAVPSVNFGGPVALVPVIEFSPEHAVAAMLHGWVAHKEITGKDFECDLQVYLDALKVANRPSIKRDPPDAPTRLRPKHGYHKAHARKIRHTYEPLQAAMSPHAPHADRKTEVA